MPLRIVLLLLLSAICAAAQNEHEEWRQVNDVTVRQEKKENSATTRERVQKTFILTLEPESNPDAQPWKVRKEVENMQMEGKSAQCRVTQVYYKLRMLRVFCATATTQGRVLQLDSLLKKLPGVAHATPDAMLTTDPSKSTVKDNDDGIGPDTPMFQPASRVQLKLGQGMVPYNWGLDRIDEDYSPLDNFPIDFSCYPKEGEGVKVFVIDTGCMPWHDEFSEANITTMAAPGSDFVNGIDDHGHGSHIAGVVVGKHVGVARNAEVVCIKSFDQHGNGAATDTISAVEYVIEQKARMPKRPFIVNLSYSALTGFTTTALDEIVFSSSANGIVFVVSAGNAAVNACLFSPSKAEQALTVTASTKRDTLEADSNIGPCVEFIAPGHEIVSVGIESKYDYVSENGTSMATPHIVGLSALVLAENTHLQDNPATVRDNLYELLVTTRSVEVATFIMPLMQTGCDGSPAAEFSKRSKTGQQPSVSPAPSPFPSPTPSPTPSMTPSVSPSISVSISPSPSPKSNPGGAAYWRKRKEMEMEDDLGGHQPAPSASNSHYQYYQYGLVSWD